MANIIIYDSKGNQKIIPHSFPKLEDQGLNFSDNDPALKKKNIENIIIFLTQIDELPFKLNNDGFRNINLQSILKLNDNLYTLRFTYNLDFSKINPLFPSRVPLDSKNILVRVKNGYIESISTGIQKEYLSEINKKYIIFSDYFSKRMSPDIMIKSITNFLTFLKSEKEFYYTILAQEILEMSIDYNTILKNKFANTNLFNETQILWDRLKFVSPTCGFNCQKEKINELLMKMNFNESALEQWMHSKIVNSNFAKKLFEIIKLNNDTRTSFHIDNSSDFQLIIEPPNYDSLILKLRFNAEGIHFEKYHQESNFNQINFIKTETYIHKISNNYPSANTELILTQDFEPLRDKFQIGDLNSINEKIAFILLNNQKFYKEILSFSDVFENSLLTVIYGVTEPAERAENASWVFFPHSKFVIGAGGSNFKNFENSPSLLGHEFFHYAEENLSKLYTYNESGALQEHGGDLMGMITSDELLKSKDEAPSFTVSCNIFTEKSIKKYFDKNKSYNQNLNLDLNPICMRDFLEPEKSFTRQATTKASIQKWLGKNYQSQCKGSLQNDNCGIHFQAAIPNLIVSQFMLNMKEKIPSFTWSDIRIMTAKILFNTFAGRLQSDAGFLNYGKQLKLECMDQFKNTNISEKQNELCDALEKKFIEILK